MLILNRKKRIENILLKLGLKSKLEKWDEESVEFGIEIKKIVNDLLHNKPIDNNDIERAENEMADILLLLEQFFIILGSTKSEIRHKMLKKLERTETRVLTGYYNIKTSSK